ncbi:MAG: beta-ketoacyl-ACP synthase [Xenococcaceae cyanobacterium MO_167.B27]|nr:beta-ketoacyl-ACP synthase [Xenococcaceae cyanobacterium MO_167.B27]
MNSRVQGSKQVVVTGIGLQSCLGCLEDTWQNLLLGRSGIKLQQPFPELPPYALGLIENEQILQNHQLSFPLLTKALVTDALKDAKLNTPLSDCGVVIGSSRGYQATWENLLSQDKLFSVPQAISWLDTLPHHGAVITASLIQTQAPVLSPMAACATGIHAIARGYELIQTGECERVIVGAIETPVTRLTLAAFDKMGALAKTGCYPFDLKREGLVLGEGGSVLILETVELAQSREAKIYGEVAGFSLTCDANHISAPESNGRSAAIAIKQCLQRSNLTAEDIDYIHVHGTSTKLNDRHEATLINYLFPHSVAVSSTKGATGHTLGASGAIGVAFCLMALKYGYLPPCVGLKQPEFDLNLVTKSYPASPKHTLCFSFGFGGQNAVIALSRG